MKSLTEAGSAPGHAIAASRSITEGGFLGFYRFIALAVCILALGCLHYLVFELRPVLVPFALSTLIVLAIQPTVEFVYELLSGRSWPYRWLGCGSIRRRRQADGTGDISDEDMESLREAEILLEHTRGDEGVDVLTTVGDFVCRLAAIVFVAALFVLFVIICGSLLLNSVIAMKDNWKTYIIGIGNVTAWVNASIDWIEKRLQFSGGAGTWMKAFNAKLESGLSDAAVEAMDSFASTLTGSISFLIILLLYILLWLLQPLPMIGTVSIFVRSYVWKKTISSMALGICVTVYLTILKVDLAAVFGLITFCLNYVPEVGAVLSMLLPIPVIIFDSRLESPVLTLAMALGGLLIIKFLFGNILEVKLIEMDQEARIHPVWVVLGLNYFGFIWGPIGMLMSVPFLAVFKTVALALSTSSSEEVAKSAEFVFLCLEGRRKDPKEAKSTARRLSAKLMAGRRSSAQQGEARVECT